MARKNKKAFKSKRNQPQSTTQSKTDSGRQENKRLMPGKTDPIAIGWKRSYMSGPILPGSWKTNAAIFLLLIIATQFLYAGDLHLGFFSVDDPGYVTDNPWIKSFSLGNLGHIFTVPYFANYSPIHLLSYMVDFAIAGSNAFAFHLSSNIWAGIVAGFVYLVALALIRDRIIALVAAVLFVLHPVHVEAIAWVSSRKDLVAAAFALPSLLAYIRYRQGGLSAKWWYILSLFLFMLAVGGKLSVATFPAVLLALDLFVEKRPFVRSVIDKLPFLLIGICFALAVASAQPSSGNTPDPFIYLASFGQSLWLLTGFGSYVIYRVPPEPAGTGLEIVASVGLIAVFLLPLLLRRRLPVLVVLIYWALFTYLPSQVLSFVHPVTDRYLFMPSVAMVILIAWGVISLGKRFGRPGVIGLSLALLIIAVLWGRASINYLSEWQDPRSVWFASAKKSNDADVYYSIGANYLTLSSQFGATPRGGPISEDKRERLASAVWKEDSRLEKLLSEWKGGQHAGPVEKEFQSHLWKLSEDAFNQALQTKGTRSLPHLYFRLGVLLLDRGDLEGAKKEFLAAIDETSRFTVTDVGHELTVVSYSNLGLVAMKQNNFREALHWYQLGEEAQTRFGGNWVPDLTNQRKRMQATVGMLSGSKENTEKTNDPDIAYNLGLHYLNIADRLSAAARGTSLVIEDAKQLANEVWKDNSQLSLLLAEWAAGQRGGPVEKTFQEHLKTLAWDAFERSLQAKGDRIMPGLYFRRGMILGQRGNLQGAKKEFIAALDEASHATDIKAQQEIIVDSHDALGVLAQTAGDYKEALRWFKLAEEEQIRFGGNWVPDISSKRQRMETIISSKPAK